MRGDEAAAGQAGRQGRRARQAHLSRPARASSQSRRRAEQLIDEACEALAPLGPAAGGLGSAGPIRPGKESLMDELLSTISSPARPARALARSSSTQLAGEMREVLCRLVGTRTAHFASNLGVVELSPGPAHHVRFQPRPPDLGHRPPDLSAQADHRPLPRVRARSAPRAA